MTKDELSMLLFERYSACRRVYAQDLSLHSKRKMLRAYSRFYGVFTRRGE